MTNSVYAASIIHSKSTLSRKYDVDTSAIFNLGEQFHDSDPNDSTLTQLLQTFSLDVGRFDFPFSWINITRFFIFPFALIYSSLGLVLLDTTDMDSISRTIYNILRYIMIFTPEGTSFNIILSVNLVFLITYFTLIVFLLSMIYRYKNSSCPTNFQIYFWIIFSRIVMPLFTMYLSHIFSHSLYNLMTNTMNNISISTFFISIPLLLAHLLYIFLSCSVYNATPIIRKNDKSQLWFSHSKFDWLLNFFQFFQVLIQNLFLLVTFPACTILYAILISVETVIVSLYLVARLPYIHPTANSIVLGCSLSGPFCSLLPVITYYQKRGAAIALVPLIVIIVIMFFLARFIINYRMKTIMLHFAKLQETTGEEDKAQLDPLSAAFMQLNPTHAVDFAKLGLKGEKDFSLYLRVGFLFNQPEVTNNLFIKWTTDQNLKADLILSACQVSYALQNDVRMLNTLEQMCHKIGSAPYNYKSFVILFNHLRQELLTQLNTPLLEAIGRAKKSDHALQSTISEFWGSVMKQRVDTMISILPRISDEMIRTELLFQRLMRNYSKAPTAYREATLFYHKSIGNHNKSMEAQSMYNKIKNQGSTKEESSDDSLTSTSFGDVDNDFRERMEPWIEAQSVISGLPLNSSTLLTILLVASYILMIILPIIILAISIHDIERFESMISPIQTVGDIQHAITRIPQLIRRKQLFQFNEILPWFESTGSPLGTILEFLNEEAILPSASYYLNMIDGYSNDFLDLCSSSDVIYDTCLDSSHQMITGSTNKSTTVYELLMAFQSASNSIVHDNDFDWMNANSSSNFMFIFENFDELYNSFSNFLHVLSEAFLDFRFYFQKMTTIFFILIWVLPIVLIMPFTIITMIYIRKDIIFTLKMFFHIPKNEISSLKWSAKSKKNKGMFGRNNQDFLAQASTAFDGAFNVKKDLLENLATIPRKTSGLFLEFLVSFIIFILFTAIMTSIGIIDFNSSMMDIIDMSNGYVDAIEVYSRALASYIWIQELFSTSKILENNSTMLKIKGQKYILEFQTLFDDFLYGCKESMTPGLLLGNDVINSYVVSNSIVSSSMIDFDPIYGVLHEVYFSMSCESQMRLLDELSRFVLSPDIDLNLSFNDEFVYHYEHLIFVHLDGFLIEGRELFNYKLDSLNQNKVDELILVFIVMLVSQLIYIFTILLTAFLHLRHYIYTPRNLMQLVMPEMLLKNQSLIKWLSGNLTSTRSIFSVEINNQTKASLTDFIVQHSKCGIMVINEENKIERINKPISSLFNTQEEQILNQDLIEFLSKHLIDKDKSTTLRQFGQYIEKMKQGSSQANKFSINTTVINSNSQLVYLEIAVEVFVDDETGQFISSHKTLYITICDRSVEHNQELLVEAEKKKSESLINSLMPEMITKQLNDGETEISFDVPKATILFATISNWDELLSKIDHSQIIILLNTIFSSYDLLLQNFETLTKIKTFGPTYMVAGGLFHDPSINSAQHIIEFGLQIFSAINGICKEIGETIKISIGVNTGPISCGILGNIRPVFDIVGNTINLAYILTENDTPGHILISETTYEDIKFLTFSIREGTEIKYKEKHVKTYSIVFGGISGKSSLF